MSLLPGGAISIKRQRRRGKPDSDLLAPGVAVARTRHGLALLVATR